MHVLSFKEHLRHIDSPLSPVRRVLQPHPTQIASGAALFAEPGSVASIRYFFLSGTGNAVTLGPVRSSLGALAMGSLRTRCFFG